MDKFILTIDGPSGVGKTSVGKSIANILDSSFFSSGSVYRSAAKYLLNNKNIHIKDLKIEIVSEQCHVNGIIFEEDDLYENEVSIKSSEIAKKMDLRILVKNCLITYFEKLDRPLVIEGRDMGSVVFPDADHKVYLDADLETRGRRREGQSNMEETVSDVRKRDFEDQNRLISPLTIPEGALIVDNSNLTIDETIELIIESLKLR